MGVPYSRKKNKRSSINNLNISNKNSDDKYIRNCFVFLDDIFWYTNSISNLNKLCGNGSCESIYKFKLKISKLKSNLISRDKLANTSRKSIFDCVIPNRAAYVDYSSPGMIYLINFKRCSLQYFRETVQNLNKLAQ